MSIKKMTKEELELMSYKDITHLLVEEEGAASTAQLFKRIVDLLELPDSVFETKIGDYYTSLTTDKRFTLLDDGKWDLKTRHPKKKIVIEGDLDELDEIDLDEVVDTIEDDDNDSYDDESEEEDTDSGEYKDLIIVDEEELGLEE